jgi:AraC-like DNA-binding protein
MSKPQDTLLASMRPILRRLLEMHGLDSVALARQVGIVIPEELAPTDRIQADKGDAVLQLAIPLIHDPAFGLQVARCWHPANLGVLGYAWLSSSTLRTGLRRMERYHRLVGDRGATEIEEVRQGIKVRFWAKRGDPAEVPVAAVAVDMAIALLLDMCRLNAGAALRPVAVSLRRKKPEATAPYERFFGCPVRFGAAENFFLLAREDADALLPSSNKQLATVFDTMLGAELALLDKSDVIARCRAAVLEHLTSGEASEEDTAKQLNMSPRTLQRKLAEASLTYQQLLDATRRDLALRYIDDGGRSISDITFSLGFSQPSAFTRAFKRWTGSSPSDYRAERSSGNAA